MTVDKQYLARLREYCEVDGVRDGANALNCAVISVFAMLPDLLTAFEKQAIELEALRKEANEKH